MKSNILFRGLSFLVIVLLTACGSAFTEKEPNNTPAQSTVVNIENDTIWKGRISPAADKDCYSFTVKKDKMKNVRLDIQLLHDAKYDLSFKLYRDGRLIKSVDDWAAGGKQSSADKGIPVRDKVEERFSNLTLSKGRYLVVVKQAGGKKRAKESPYRLRFSTGVRSQFMEIEPNDSRSSATVLQAGSSMEGWYSPAQSNSDKKIKEQDWYRIEIQLSNRGLLDVELSGVPGVDAVLEVYSKHGGRPLKKVNANGIHLGERIDKLAVKGNEVYFIRVVAAGAVQLNHEIAYSIRATVTAYRPGMEMEPNDSVNTANPLAMNSESSGLLTPAGDNDYFSFIIPQPGKYMFSARVKGVPEVDISLILYNENGKWIRTFNNYGTGEAEYIVNYGLITKGFDNKYYLRIKAAKGANNRDAYRVYLSLHDASGSSEFEPNDRSANANQLASGQDVRGLIFPRKDKDWYQFSLKENKLVRVQVTGIPTVDLHMTLYSKSLKKFKYVNKNGKHNGETLSMDLQGPGNYYLKISAVRNWHYNPRETYTLKMLTGKPFALPVGPTVKSNSKSSSNTAPLSVTNSGN